MRALPTGSSLCIPRHGVAQGWGNTMACAVLCAGRVQRMLMGLLVSAQLSPCPELCIVVGL